MPGNYRLRWKCHGKSSGYVQSLLCEHLLNACAVHTGWDVLVIWLIALNLVFSLQALGESSGREVLWLRCSELTVGLHKTSHLAGASQLHFCTPSSSAWFLLVKGRCEVGFDLGHLLTANVSVLELGKCRIWLWLEVESPDFGTWLFKGPLRFLLFTQS